MMSTSLDRLLPGPDEIVGCASHARTIGAYPGGTAIRADLVVLVDTPGPWPKSALEHPLPAAMVEGLAASPAPIRVLAAVPRPVSAAPTATVYRRQGGSASRTRYRVDGVDHLRLLGAALVDEDDPIGPAAAPGTELLVHDPIAPSTVLICTQGSHDMCCGSEGERLASLLEDRPVPVEIRRVSHMGGHRFAPTAMTLPDGRMWAWLDGDDVAAIVTHPPSGPVPARLLERCRGWWGAGAGPAQVAEQAVLNAEGWALDRWGRLVTAVGMTADRGGAHGPGAGAWSVEAGERRWRVEVAPGRAVPIITCREPGGLPAKSALEYRVVSVDELPIDGDQPG
jgi:hypothetical protein